MKLKLDKTKINSNNWNSNKILLVIFIILLIITTILMLFGDKIFYVNQSEQSNEIDNIQSEKLTIINEIGFSAYSLDEHRKDNINSKIYWRKKINGTEVKLKKLQSVEDLYKEKYGNKAYENVERNCYINLTDYKKQYDNSTTR